MSLALAQQFDLGFEFSNSRFELRSGGFEPHSRQRRFAGGVLVHKADYRAVNDQRWVETAFRAGDRPSEGRTDAPVRVVSLSLDNVAAVEAKSPPHLLVRPARSSKDLLKALDAGW